MEDIVVVFVERERTLLFIINIWAKAVAIMLLFGKQEPRDRCLIGEPYHFTVTSTFLDLYHSGRLSTVEDGWFRITPLFHSLLQGGFTMTLTVPRSTLDCRLCM